MASPTVNIRNDYFTSEFEINDSPPEARKMLTKGFIQEEISRFSGAAISTRGCYINKKEAGQTDKGRPLYLFLQGPTKHCIQLAIQKIHEIIRHDIASSLNRANRSKCASDRLYVGLDGVPASFDLRGKIIGQNASNFAFIRSESGAAVTLCGGQGPEDEPLHILLEHSSQEGLNSAKVLTANLIETLTQEFHQIQFNQQISLPPAHPGAPPQLQVHQQTQQVNGPAMQINVPTSQMNYNQLPMQLTGLPPTQVNIPSSQLSVGPMQMSAPPGQMSVVPSHMTASPAQAQAQPQPSMVTQMSMPPTTGNPLMRQQPVQNNSNMVVSSGPTPPSVHNYHPMEPLAGHTIQVNIPPPGMHIPQRVGPMIPPAVSSGGYVSAENQMACQAPAPATPHLMVATTSNVQTERLAGPESARPLQMQMQMNVPPPAVHMAFHSAAKSEQVHATAERPRKRRFDEVVWEDKGQNQQQTVSANGPTSYVGRSLDAGAQGHSSPADAANFKKVPHWSANEIHTKGEMPLNPLPKADMSPALAAHQVKSHADVTNMPNVQKTLWSEHKVEIQEYHSNSLHADNKQGKVPYYQITSSSGSDCTTSPGNNNVLHPSFIPPGGLILTEVPQPQSTQQPGPPANLQSMVIHHTNPPNRMQPMLLAPHSVQHVMIPANANTIQSIGFNSSNTKIQSGAGFSSSPTFQQGPMPPQRIGRGVLNIIQSDGFTCNSVQGRGPMQPEGSRSMQVQAQMVSGEGQQGTFSSSDMQYSTVVTMNVQPNMMPSNIVQGGMHFVTANQGQQLQPLNAYANSNVFVQQHDAPATGHSMQLATVAPGQTTLQCTNVPPPNMVNRYEPPTQLVQNYSVWPGNT